MNKIHYCKDLTNEIRKVSDRLCEEYGLNVLYGTQEMKLVKYKSADGKTRFYEPTERKNAMLAKRGGGEIKGGANDYRNTPPYKEASDKPPRNAETVLRYIEVYIGVLSSYNLLSRPFYKEFIALVKDLCYSLSDGDKVDETGV